MDKGISIMAAARFDKWMLMMYEQVRQIRNLLPCEHCTNTVLLAVILNIDVPKVFRNMILDLPVALNNKAKGGKLHKKQALNELISSINMETRCS
jgi:hypothetical protein